MPEIERLKDIIQQNIDANASNQTAYFTLMDANYAYSLSYFIILLW